MPRAVLLIVLGLAALPGAGRAAEPIGTAQPGDLPKTLANVTLLSDIAMAHENAAGAQHAPVTSERGEPAKVQLWDELRMLPELPSPANGTVTLSTGGGAGK
ncbi:MAG TPA: hypothetical protein VGR45_08760 [Stellaceae bacterium]|nr:hypothetical protein [Stellaceae bacterium]